MGPASQGIRDFVVINDITHCSQNETTVTSYKKYYTEYYESNTFENEVKISSTGEASYGGVGVNWKAKFNKQGSEDEENMKTLFQESSAEIVIGYKKCYKKTLEWGTLRPLFSSNFLKSLRHLDDLLSNNDYAAANLRMKTFINDFGTHYFSKADMGYALRYERRFESKSVDTEEESKREQCSKSEVKLCVGASVDSGAFSASGENCGEYNESGCREVREKSEESKKGTRDASSYVGIGISTHVAFNDDQNDALFH
jgi:hypothetical protein